MVLVLTIAALSLIGVREFAVAVRAWDDMTQEGSRMRLHNMARLVSHIAVLVLLFGIGWELATLHNIKRYLDIMREIRTAILRGNYPEYLRGARAVAVED